MKHCPQCKRTMPSTKFGVAQDRSDGLSGWCLECRAAKMRAWRKAHPAAVRADNAARYDLPKHAAKVAVHRAVKAGVLIKPKVCSRCHLPRRRVEAHHFAGYAPEHRLTVEWLCRPCHTLQHSRGEVAA